jgi:hypothetical protein
MVWLAGAASSYEQAAAIFKRIGQRDIPTSSIWRQSQQQGEKLKAYVEHQQDLVRVERVRLPAPWEDHQQRKGVSLDGGMVHIREEGWKEFKVGSVYDMVMKPERDPLTGDWDEWPRAERIQYAAILGGVAEFSPALWKVAVEADVPGAAQSSVTADGAAWIWNLAADLFPDSAEIVDWYHACQHLAQAAAALFPDDPQTAQGWFKMVKDYLFFGEIQRITAPLDAAGLTDHARYFHTHKHRMHYQRFQAEGFPIGSGSVESGIKQFKARLTGPGMRWSRPGAQRMLLIRSAVLSDTL